MRLKFFLNITRNDIRNIHVCIKNPFKTDVMCKIQSLIANRRRKKMNV